MGQMRALRTLIGLIALIAAAQAILPFLPISHEALWPVRAVARELFPLFFVVNLAGAAAALLCRRLLLPVFLAGLVVCAVPLQQATSLGATMNQQWEGQGFAAAPLQLQSMADVLAGPANAFSAPPVAAEALSPTLHLYRASRDSRGKPRPIVVDVHGGSWQVGSVREDAAFARIMAARGYAVFAVDYRKAPGHPFPAQLDDVRDAIAFVHAHAADYHADPQRLALVGRSAGGQLAMLAAYGDSDRRIRAVVSIYGPTDLTEEYEHPPSPDPLRVREKFEALLQGPPQQRPELYRLASPTTFVRADLPPTLQIQGGADRVVPPRFAREMHARLLEAGSRSLLLELPWADHSFDFVHFGPGATISVSMIDQFLRATLSRSFASGLRDRRGNP